MTATVGAGLSVRDVRAGRPPAVLAVSGRLESQRRRVIGLAQLVLWRRSVGKRWSGAASSAAADRFGLAVAGLGQLGQSLALAAQSLVVAAGRMQAALDLVARAERRAGAEGAWVDHEGTLFLPVRAALGDPATEAHRARLDELLRAEVAACLLRARECATEADAELLRSLLASARGSVPLQGRGAGGGWGHGEPLVVGVGGVALTLPAPPLPVPRDRDGGRNAAVFASAAWWRSLTDDERRRAIRERPDWVGPRDGVPAAARHEANLVLLARAERAATERAREVDSEVATPWNAHERTRAVERLADLRAIRDVLGRHDGVERRLLLVDLGERDVKAVVAVGDVDRAAHVATFVGGLTTTVRDDLGRYDATFVRMRSEGEHIARGGVAVVTWMGYAAPQLDEIVSSVDRNVLNAKLARDNADALADFATGLEAAREQPAHQTVWAHSYGGLLAGFAVLRTSALDDVAVFGAPGLPFGDLRQTALAPGSLNVLGAIGDDVFAYGWLAHGTRPGDVAGAARLSTFAPKASGFGCNHWLHPRSDFVDVGRTSSGHSDYLRAGTDSAHNLVAVAAGRPDLRILQGPDERACTTTGPSLGLDPLRWPRLVP